MQRGMFPAGNGFGTSMEPFPQDSAPGHEEFVETGLEEAVAAALRPLLVPISPRPESVSEPFSSPSASPTGCSQILLGTLDHDGAVL